MSAPVVYRSSDTSAPSLNGNAGSLISVLDGCLVNGYGTQPAAGWTKAFSGTNKADYRQAAGNQFYLDVDDSAAQTALGKEANVRGYEAMTALQTGTNPFPTTAQIASPGLNIRKSAATGTTSRAWLLIADDRTFHFFVLTGDAAGYYFGFSFGDVYSYVSADAGRTMIAARSNANAATDTWLNMGQQWNLHRTGLYLARNSAGSAGAIQFGGSMPTTDGNDSPQTLSSPDPIGGQIWISRVTLGSANDSARGIRGFMRGFYLLENTVTPKLNDGDTFSGTGTLAGRSFLVLASAHYSQATTADNNSSLYAIETSNTWDTSS